MLQRNISGESTSIKISIEIQGFQQPVTFTCDGTFLLCELELACKAQNGGLRLHAQSRLSVLIIPGSQVHGLFVGNVKKVIEERTCMWVTASIHQKIFRS